MNVGSVGDTIHTGFPVEASNFAKPSYALNLQEIADCLNSPKPEGFKMITAEEAENTLSLTGQMIEAKQ